VTSSRKICASLIASAVSIPLVLFSSPSFAQRDQAKALSAKAMELREAGRYREAFPLLEQALAIREKTVSPAWFAEGAYALADLYIHRGYFAEAETLYKRALEKLEKTRGLDDVYVGKGLTELADFYSLMGRYTEAEPLEKRALAIYEKVYGSNHPFVAIQLHNLASGYDQQGRYAEAEPLHERALPIVEKARGPEDPLVADSLANLGDHYDRTGRYAKAEPFLKRALAIYEKALGPEGDMVAARLNALALLYVHQDRYAEAETLYKRALSIREKVLGSAAPGLAESRNSLATVYRDQGRYAEALPLVQREMASENASPPIALPVLMGAAANGLIPLESAFNDSLNVIQRAAQSSAAAALNKLAVRVAAGDDRLAQLVRKDQDLAAEADALDKEIVTAISKESIKRDAAAEQRIRNRIATIVRERAALQRLFAHEFPDYTVLSNPLPITVKEIQDLLSDNEALLLLVPGDRESYVLTVTCDSFNWKTIPLGAKSLELKIAMFRRGLDLEALARGDWRGLFDLGLAHELYDALMGPVEPLIRDRHHLILVPSGALTALPFHLLVTETPALPVPLVKTSSDLAAYRDAAWLLKRHAVSVLPSVASLKALRTFARKEQASKPLVGFGDPVFNEEEESRTGAGQRKAVATRSYTEFWKGMQIDRSMLSQALPRLPETTAELLAVAKNLGAPESSIHLRRDASETTIKRMALADYRVVYFATHGLVAGDIKGLAEPSLALSLPKEPSNLDDGLLTASEVAQLKLNADWVVLSACNTIAGDKPGSEALSGLARAFFYAGARSLLVSHWAVESNAATQLTTSTFDILKSDPKLGRAEALRRAMLAYMNDTMDPLSAYPALWAPFVVVGEGAAR
jgi:CHAT domain-containing protein